MTKPFAFDQSWHFSAPPAAVWTTIGDVERYPTWWPWLRQFDTGGGGLTAGTSARCAVRGPLPYQLSFTVTVEEVQPESLVTARVTGDLDGPARLELQPEGGTTVARLVWSVELRDPVLRAAARVARPLMEWGHDWVVDNGVRQFERQALAR